MNHLAAVAEHAAHFIERAVQVRRGLGDQKRECSLQLDCMKSESLVIADQHVAVNTFPGLVHTARHTMGAGCTRSR